VVATQSTKSQIPNSKQITMTKIPNSKLVSPGTTALNHVSVIEYWDLRLRLEHSGDLFGIWCLEFGISYSNQYNLV
jgi:hypothetical protein